MSTVLLDTGPLVATINRRDDRHQWASWQLSRLRPPFLTCEAVLTEACFLLSPYRGAKRAVMEMVARRLLSLPFRLEEEAEPVARLMARYADIPMSLADACLVRMAELYATSSILTLDRDFRIYRKHGRQTIPVLIPEEA